MAEDFSIEIDGTSTTFADGSQFSVFDNNEVYQSYKVVFTGEADNTEYILSNLTVAGEVIEAGPYTIKTPPPALAQPTNLVWDSTIPGKAKWDAVPNASSYKVQLYKGSPSSLLGSSMDVPTGTEHDFTSAITTAGYDSYTFRVTAIGDGSDYGNSQMSSASPAYDYTAPAEDTVIEMAVIAGVTAPATGGVPVMTITGSDQYTGTVTWSPTVASNFAAGTQYTATITLTPKAGYTLTGVTEDFFTVAGATATNPADSGVVTAIFPATEPLVTVVCEVSTTPVTKCESLAQALAIVEDGQTITLLQNINHNTDDPADVITIDSKTVTFNLAGYTLNVGSSSAAKAIVVENGGKLELFGDSGELNVTASGIAVQVESEGSSAVVTSATSRDNCAVYASFGGEITVQGDAEGKTCGACAVGATNMISKITVGRDAKSTGDYSAAAQVRSGGQLTVNGNAIATGYDSKGVSAEHNGSKMHVKGKAQGEKYGVYASLSAEVIIDGDVVGTAYGVEARTKSKVTVKGDVSASGGIGVFAMSNAQNTPTEVTVDGAITGRDAEYIKLDGVSKSEEDKTIPTTKLGYHTYTQTNFEYNYTSTVWVRDSSAPIGEAVWNYRSPLPSPHSIEDIKYVNGQYMAVGYNGTLLSSADGTSWQKVSLGTDIDRLGGIAYGGGKYVLVGHVNEIAGLIYTSDDGATWQETAAVPYQWLHDVAYGNGKFVAVGSAGKILTSSDGVTWKTHAVTYPDGKSTTLLSIAYSNSDGRFVAAGMGAISDQHKGGIMTSADGVNWEFPYSNSTNTIWDVTCGGGKYVAVGGQSSYGSSDRYVIATSSDGKNWTQASSGSSAYGVLYSADWNGTQFIAVGSTSSDNALVLVSDDGSSWTPKAGSGLPGFRAAAANGTRIVAMGSYGNIYTSDDVGSNWTYRTLGTTKTLNDVAYNGSSLYVAVGLEGTIQTSADGQTWTIQNSNTNIDLNKVDYLNNQFIAVGKSGTILTSTDGTTWTARTSGVTTELKGLAYGDGKYLVVGGNSSSNPVVLTSSDGSVWSSDNMAGIIQRSFVAVAYGNNSFLAVMQYGQAYRYSVDSDSGELIHSRVTDLGNSGCYPTDIVYGGDKFAAVGGNGEVYLTSDKGDSWTKLDTDLDSYSQGIAYGGGNFVAVGELGKIMASADGGTTWFLQPSGLPHNHYSTNNRTGLNSIVAGNDCFVVVGEDGIVLQSDSFTVSADADANDVDVARRALYASHILSSGLNSENNIIANMNLMTSWNKGTTITWSSSKPATIASDGTVVRPAFGDGDKVVNLTATITKGSASAVKTFIVVVIAQPDPDIAIVEQALNTLTFDVIKGSNTAENNITSDLTLIIDGENGTSVSWSSNKPATIADDGTVTRPAEGASDEAVTLTATVSKGTVTRTRTFNLTVKAQVSPDAEDVAAAKTALTFDVIKGSNTQTSNITSDLNLIADGGNGTSISWSSDKPVTIATDGTVARPAQGEADIAVTLTATISKGSASDTKPFNLTVKAKSVLDVSDIAVKTQPADLTYTAGETLNLNGLVVTLTYNDSTTLDVGLENFTVMSISANPAHGTGLTVANHHNKPVVLTCNGKTAGTGNLNVTSSSSEDSGGGGGGGGGGDSTPPANTTTITPNQIDTQLQTNQSFEVQHEGLQIAIDPEDLPIPPPSGSIQVESTIITEPNALNTFFIQYPGQQGILRGYNITFTQQNSSGQSEEITQLNGEITLTFQLTPEELEGIDPSTLVVYKQAEDGSISEYSAEFDWATNSLSISTSHLCEFFIMGKAGIPTQRLAGNNRYATAVDISTQGFVTSDYVVLASGENFPDALAGTVLAAVKSAPVLLTGKEALSSETLAEIKRLQAKHIYLLGGPGVISQAVEDLLTRDYIVTRISGSNRYETAVKIGELTANTDTDTAIIATGSGYPDALSVASFAGQNRLPILFTEKDGLNTLTAQALSKWGIKNVILVGGSGVISAQTETLLREEMELSVTRLSGTDRYQTGLEIAKYFAGSQSDPYQYAALATGINFPDALAGASLAAKLKMPVLLTGKDKVSPEIKAYLEGLNLEKLYIFGGQGAVPDSVKEEVSRNK